MPPMTCSLHKLLGVFHSPSWNVFLAEFVVNSAHIGSVKQGDCFFPWEVYIIGTHRI